MNDKTVYAFDVETQRLAAEVEGEFADELAGASPWARPDLFGFGCGVVIDLETNVAFRHLDPEAMISHLREADLTVGYNTAAFDLGVLSAAGNVTEICHKHTDLNLLVRAALDVLPEARGGDVRISQGGLDGLARANGLEGKTLSGTVVPQMLREGRAEEVLDYCEADTRLGTVLDSLANRPTRGGRLHEARRREGRTRTAGGSYRGGDTMSNPVGSYTKEFHGEEVTVELWRAQDFAAHVREEAPQDAVCGCILLEPDLDYLIEERAHYDSEVGMIPAWAEGERHALVMAKLLNVSVLDSHVPDAYWLKSIPEDAPQKIVEKLQQRG